MPEIEKLLCRHPHWPQVKAIAEKLREGGFEAVLAGGGVRDALLGKAPKDFDLAASAKPKEMLKIFPFAKAWEKYGTVLVPLKNPSFRLEITSFRTESAYTDGRRPDSVRFASMKEDAQRRDFTVNALFYDLQKKKIIDFAGGRKDLKQRLLRAVGDPKARFEEDRLRPLRALRLAHQLGFSIERETRKAIPPFAPLLKAISKERVADETRKMLSCGRPGQALALLRESGFMGPALSLPDFPPAGALAPASLVKDKPAPAAFWDQKLSLFADEAFLWSVAGMPYFFAQSAVSAAGLAPGAAGFRKFLQDLKLSSAVCKKSLSYFQSLETLILTPQKSPFAEKMKAFEGRKAPVRELGLAWLKSHGLPARGFMRLLREFEQRETPEGRLPAPLVTGEDLLQRGMPQGKPLGRLLEKAFAFQLENPQAGKAGILKRLREEGLL